MDFYMSLKMDYEDEVLLMLRKFFHSIDSRKKAVADMPLLADAMSHLSLTNLDRWERLLRWEFCMALESSTPDKWKFRTGTKPFLTWIDLCDRDGFKREKTLRTLSGAAPNSFFLALAVRRLNDWVPQVREAAREKLFKIASNSDPEHVVDVLCVILPHWTSWGRMKDEDKQVLLDITSIPKVVLSLKSRIISATSGPMASILSQAGRTEIFDKYINEIAKNAIQPSVRAKAYSCQLQNKMVWFAGRKWKWIDKAYCKQRLEPILCERTLSVSAPFLKTLKMAARDRSPIVRRVAGDMLIQKLNKIGTESFELAELLASDPSPSVAERGDFALKRLGKSL